MSKKLKCLYQNTRGLRTKIAPGLKSRISCTEFNIVALTETWLNDKINLNEIFDRTANSNGVDNDNFLGGGSLMAINRNIPAALRLTE